MLVRSPDARVVLDEVTMPSVDDAVRAPVDFPACPACAAHGARPLVRTRAQMSARDQAFAFVQCERCGLAYLADPPSDLELQSYYEEYLPHRGAAAWGRWAGIVAWAQAGTDAARVEVVRRHLHRDASTSVVLDVGCGRPTFLAELKRRLPAVRAVGTDWSSAGWSGSEAPWRGLELHERDVPPPELREACDVITLWHLLEHVRSPVALLSELRQFARRGAAVIIEVPNLDSLTARLQGSTWAGYHTPRHMSAFTPATIRDVLARAGWRDIAVQAHGTLDPYLLWWLGRQERRGWSAGSFESRFPAFLAGKLLALPLTMLQRMVPLGVMTAVARA